MGGAARGHKVGWIPAIVGVIVGTLVIFAVAYQLVAPDPNNADLQMRGDGGVLNPMVPILSVAGGVVAIVGNIAAATITRPASELSKQCPRCAEKIKVAAVVCRFCGHEFTDGAGG